MEHQLSSSLSPAVALAGGFRSASIEIPPPLPDTVPLPPAPHPAPPGPEPVPPEVEEPPLSPGSPAPVREPGQPAPPARAVYG